MPNLLSADLIKIKTTKFCQKKQKEISIRVTVGIRLIYDDGMRVKSPVNGQTYIGKGTQAFYSYIYNTINWRPPQRFKTDHLRRPETDQHGVVLWEPADLSSKSSGGNASQSKADSPSESWPTCSTNRMRLRPKLPSKWRKRLKPTPRAGGVNDTPPALLFGGIMRIKPRLHWQTYRGFRYARRQDGSYLARFLGDRRIIGYGGDLAAMLNYIDEYIGLLAHAA